MCSVEKDIEELTLSSCSDDIRPEKDLKTLNVCRKCGQTSVVLLQKKDPMCKECFMVYCVHKFKSTIGKSKKVKHGSKVLISHSGGSCSTAMLRLVAQGLADSATKSKKLLIFPGVLHINESSIISLESKEHLEAINHVKNEAKTLNLHVMFSSLEMAFQDDRDDIKLYWESSDEDGNEGLKRKLLQSLSSIKSLSCKQDYIECLRMKLMTDIALQSGYDYLFVGDSATKLAMKSLSSIALGRGSQISANTSFFDTRYKVPVCRPLREFLNKEIAYFNKLNVYNYFVYPSLLTMTDVHSSIQRLTEAFVCGLQEEFPATVFTIFRTGGKVTALPVESPEAITSKCIICQSLLDNVNPPPCSALEALRLSAKLSRKLDETKIFSKEVVEAHNNDAAFRLHSVFETCTCHGCQVIIGEMDPELLPQPLLEKMKENNRANMKERIQDYLLEDEQESDNS